MTKEEIVEAVKILSEAYPEGVTARQIWQEFFKDKGSIATFRVAIMKTSGLLKRTQDPRASASTVQYVYRPILEEESTPAVSTSLPPDAKPLIIEDVLSALESLCQENRVSTTARELHEKVFPQHPAEKVRSLLNYLTETGKVAFVKEGQAKLYHPTWMWPKKPTPLPPPVTKPTENKRVLAFQCEVCQALVGLKAQEGIFTVDCPGCNSTYMANKGWVCRLYPGIKAQVWTPCTTGGR